MFSEYAVNVFAASNEVREFWLGGYDFDNSGTFNWTVDDNTVDKMWILDRLADSDGQYFCTSSKLWHNKRFASNCFLAKAYVCAVDAPLCTTSAEKSIHEQCPHGFIYIEPFHTCYKFFSNIIRFGEAENSCRNLKAHLLSVRSDFERKFLDGFARDMFPSTVRDFWIGLSSQEIFGIWRWNDHSPLIFHNWASGEPSNNLTDQCALMSKVTSKWSAVNCFKEHAYICALSLDCPTHPKNKVKFIYLFVFLHLMN
uniref:C-type lectin domain-containing protein n=1 Tax=Parascaris univalens TaxID=6257 RepID=A0A915BTM9_PARUN